MKMNKEFLKLFGKNFLFIVAGALAFMAFMFVVVLLFKLAIEVAGSVGAGVLIVLLGGGLAALFATLYQWDGSKK